MNQPIGQQLGLGRNWQPSPANIEWAEIQIPQGRMIVMKVETVAGAVGVAFDEDGLRRFIEQAQQRSTGITIPQMNIRPNGGGHP